MTADDQLKNLPPKANLRPKEVAKFLNCKLTAVYEQIHAGVYPAFRLIASGSGVRGALRIPRDTFVAWYEKEAGGGSRD